MALSVLHHHHVKSGLKRLLPRLVWELTRRVTARNLLFGIIFTLVVRKYRTDGMVFEIPGKLFPLRDRSSLLFDKYERAERVACETHVRSTDRVMEFGGGAGIISCSINRKLANPEAHVVVEANPEALPYLHRNRMRNAARFMIVHGVVSPKEIEKMHFGKALSEISQESPETRIPGVSPAELHRRYGPFNVLVMDIEGAELYVATDHRDLLRGYRLIILELHPSIIGEEACDRIRAIFSSCGFERSGERSCVEAWVQPEGANL
jgi:FkbM family methyltransferase